MPAPPLFQRAPRISPELPRGEVEIPAPPPLPPAPFNSLATTLLPRLGALGGVGAVVFGATQSNMAVILPALGIAVAGAGATVLGYASQRNGHRKLLKAREARYRSVLAARKADLVAKRDQQIAALLQTDPAPGECLQLVQRFDSRMWQRSPRDPDFLSLRLGLGNQPFSVQVKTPTRDTAFESDTLADDALNLSTEFQQVSGAPIRLGVPTSGVAGIAGTRGAVLNTARALALQIATHHSPDEVKICALFPAYEAADWAWLRWLPHVWTEDRRQRLLASDKAGAQALLNSLYDMLGRRRTRANNVPGAQVNVRPIAPLPVVVVFLADPSLVENKPVISLLLNESTPVGAYPIFLAESIEGLPRGCQAIVDLDAQGSARLIQTGPVASQEAFTPDRVPTEMAETLARHMAPVRLRRLSGSAEVPNVVPLLDMLGAQSLEELDVAHRWTADTLHNSLSTPIGRRAGGELLSLDLHERGHGPHGLVAGATGSGKSEMLQALIASIAVNYHPHQVAFVLIDYKGGGMSNAFNELPHLVGTITNLESSLAMRALAALRAELQRRQALLAQVGDNHIDSYQQRYWEGEVREPLPHLVIIADEFAELATELPEFMKQLISAVRVGRSLGVHLILATQKPAGVVNEQIWSNTRFRISLRVERPEDSYEVLKRPDASDLTQAGRAYFQVGNDELFELFQSGWGGAPYAPGALDVAAYNDVVEVLLDGSRRALRTSARPVSVQEASGTQLQVVVSHLADVAKAASIEKLKGPWLPPLPESVSLASIRPARGWNGRTWAVHDSPWLQPVVGLVDDPARQFQGPLSIDLGKEGHLAVYGAPGTGKTSFLHTLITSLALAYSPQDVNLYLLDFGGRGLSIFAPLPHVGGVIAPEDKERLTRLLRLLDREVATRQERFAQAGVNTLAAYRQATGDKMPAFVVVLDNYNGFAGTYPDSVDSLAALAREGGGLGVHLVLTANTPQGLPTRISGNITSVVALRLADKADYGVAMQRLGGLEPGPHEGRGLIKGSPPLEFQTALATEGETEAARTAALRTLVQDMQRAWTGPAARAVPVLPESVPLSDLLPSGESWPAPSVSEPLAVPLALDTEELQPVHVDLASGPHFIVTGPARSGKTTLLRSWTVALAERFSRERLLLFLVDFRRDGLLPLQPLPHVVTYAEDPATLNDCVASIAEALTERRQKLEDARRSAPGYLEEREFLAQFPALVLVVDDYDAVREGALPETKAQLEQLVRRERGTGLHVIVAGSTSDVGPSWDGWVKAIKEGQTGFLLGTQDQADAQILNIRLPLGEGGRLLPPGEGYYSKRGRATRIKAATTDTGSVQLRQWVARIARRAAYTPPF